MSDEALIAELERQREPARQFFADYDAWLEGRGIGRKMPDISEITAPLTAVLTAHPVFGLGRNMFFATKQLILHPYFVTQALLRVMLTSDAPSAVAWLHRLFKIDCAHLRMVAVVHGLDVLQPVSLSNGVRLLPFTAAPDSSNVRLLARQYRRWSMENPLAPTFAVFDMGPVVGSTDFEADEPMHDGAYRAILDAARAFTLADDCAPVVGDSWTDLSPPS